MRQVNTERLPADKMPVTNQHIWDMALKDYDDAVLMRDAIKAQPDATPDDIARRERVVRQRLAFCNIVDFLITNKEDISKVMAARKGKPS
ncbi:hypothetical protein [Bradyrhizobium sp. Tv2a-2]|uniref:hypothetical protein n=1 Tax=Bradyrhizobium sp. Tv2a-2 TaxID=113395 RepID=UPI0003FFA879|nr:hypothetical protein [Bradyrhizobium sp. Tv2a-2]